MSLVLHKNEFEVAICVIHMYDYEIQYNSCPFVLEGTLLEAMEVAEAIRHKYTVQCNTNKERSTIFSDLTLQTNNLPEVGRYCFELNNNEYRIVHE